MKLKKGIIFSIVFLILFLSIFYFYPYYQVRVKKIDFSNIVLKSIALKETNGLEHNIDKAISIYKYVNKHIHIPDNSTIYYSNVLGQSCKYLIAGQAYCDNQCNSLLEIAFHTDIEGRLIFLYGSDSISKHSVCELKINDKFVMFDPFLGVLLRNNSNELLGIKEISDRKKIIFDTLSKMTISKKNYLRLFDDKHPFKIVKNNQANKTENEKKIINIYEYWYSFFGEEHRIRLFDYYYFIHHVKKEDQKRINQLFD